MAYPPGVSLATITIGAGRTMFGTPPKLISATVTPIFKGTPHVVHAASGWAFYPTPQTFRVENGEELTFELPHVNAIGWRDTAGNEFPALLETGVRDKGWAYHVKFTVVGGSGQDAVPHRYEKVFQPLVGQVGPIDVDLVPDGQIGEPVSAPAPAVLSIAGLTGAVTEEQLQALGFGGASDGEIADLLQDPATSTGAAIVATIGTATADKLDAAAAAQTYSAHYGNLILGDGDSITQASVDTPARIFTDSWYTYMTALSDGRLPYVRNSGHGGWTSSQLLEVLDAEVISQLPKGGQVVWAAGRNDSMNIDLTRAADLELVERVRAAGLKPIITTIPPVGMAAMPTPGAPTVVASEAGGTLAAGSYEYRVVAKNARGVTLPSVGTSATITGSTGSVVVTWPYQPGATGWDVYRNGARVGQTTQHYAVSFTDTGQAASGAVPTSNTTAFAATAPDILHTAQVNAWRKRLGARKGITVIDFYDVLADPTTGAFKPGLSTDGVHPSPVGQRIMGTEAWRSLSPRVENARGYIAESQADPLNIYNNGLFLTGGGNPIDRPNGWASPDITNGNYTTTLAPKAEFKGNAWTVTRAKASAPAYQGAFVFNTGIKAGDVIQFACKYQRDGEATGLISEIGVRFEGITPQVHLGFWRWVGDISEPSRLVSPEVAVPAGATGLRLINAIYGGTGAVTIGQLTVTNLTTGKILA
ncbi:hypothetical protein [Kocuria sp. KH4]